MATPFDFLNAINFTKEDMFQDPQSNKDYNAFLVNRGLSYFHDTIFYANEMNRNSHLSKEQQFSFLIYSVSKKKRFSKWAKEPLLEDLENVCAFYGYSKRVAKGVLNILTEEQLNYIREKQNKGGK